ncbi:MAG TPA: hypothetical protein VID75_04430 [Acidimicrobiales bacterium]|jgi:hypothetical protein
MSLSKLTDSSFVGVSAIGVWSDQMARSEDPEYASNDLSGVVEMFAYTHSLAEVRIENDLGDVTSRLVQPDADRLR